MIQNDTGCWLIGHKLCRWSCNTTYHKAINRSAYNAVLGQDARIGMSELPLSKELLRTVHTEVGVMDLLGLSADTDIIAKFFGP